MLLHSVYTLADPRTGTIRYVGQTRHSASLRLAVHLAEAKQNLAATKKVRWLQELIGEGLDPILEVVEQCPTSDAAEREKYWIRHYRALNGILLCNMTQGGDGVVNPVLTWRHRRPRPDNTWRQINTDDFSQQEKLWMRMCCLAMGPEELSIYYKKLSKYELIYSLEAASDDPQWIELDQQSIDEISHILTQLEKLAEEFGAVGADSTVLA